MIEIIENKSNIEKTYDYDAFGNEISPDSNNTNPFRYCRDEYINGDYMTTDYREDLRVNFRRL